MLALKISSTKEFMNNLLTGDLFESFLLQEGQVSCAVSFLIDGRIHPEFYGEEMPENLPEFQYWKELRPLVLNFVKGNHTPLGLKLVLQLDPASAQSMLKKAAPESDFSQVKALALIIKYDGTSVTLTTGTAYHTFVFDKEADRIWDRNLEKYLTAKQIGWEELT